MGNRFIATDGGIESAVRAIVNKDFPSARQANLGSGGFQSPETEVVATTLSLLNITGQEFLGESSKNFMVWSTSRWGGNHIVR